LNQAQSPRYPFTRGQETFANLKMLKWFTRRQKIDGEFHPGVPLLSTPGYKHTTPTGVEYMSSNDYAPFPLGVGSTSDNTRTTITLHNVINILWNNCSLRCAFCIFGENS
jgi:hypothetical protein